MPCAGDRGSANVLPGHVAADFNVRFNRERMHRITPLNVYYFNSGVRFGPPPRPAGRENKYKIETIKIRAYNVVLLLSLRIIIIIWRNRLEPSAHGHLTSPFLSESDDAPGFPTWVPSSADKVHQFGPRTVVRHFITGRRILNDHITTPYHGPSNPNWVYS